MVSPLAHIHYFSEKSTKIMLRESGFEILFLKDFSYVIVRRLIRNIFKLPKQLYLRKILCFIILDGADTSNLEATKIITKKIIIGIDSLPRNPKIPKEGLRLVFNLNCI